MKALLIALNLVLPAFAADAPAWENATLPGSFPKTPAA